jgi:hypothetical protein
MRITREVPRTGPVRSGRERGPGWPQAARLIMITILANTRSVPHFSLFPSGVSYFFIAWLYSRGFSFGSGIPVVLSLALFPSKLRSLWVSALPGAPHMI